MLTLNKEKLFLIVGLLIVTSCGKKEIPPPRAVPAPSQAPTPVVEEIKEKPVYVYSGDHYRDPFQAAGASTNYMAEATFDPQRTTVKGIIFSPTMKSAVLNVSGSGTYFINDGKIFDVMGKAVKGYTVKVMVDRVILTGEADNVFEIKIKGTNEEAKTL